MVVQLSHSSIMLPDICFIQSRVVWVHLNFLFQISNLFTMSPHFYKVSHCNMASDPKMNCANISMIFLELLKLWNLLELICHDVLKMYCNHGF